jgi:hypothetical protein
MEFSGKIKERRILSDDEGGYDIRNALAPRRDGG